MMDAPISNTAGVAASTGLRCSTCCAPAGQPCAPGCSETSLASAVKKVIDMLGDLNTARVPLAVPAAIGMLSCALEKEQQGRASKPAAAPDGQLIYPESLTPTLAHVLGFMNFRTGPMAHVFRAAGHDIATKCEAEQAFVLDWMIRTVIRHGDKWAEVLADDLNAARAAIQRGGSDAGK